MKQITVVLIALAVICLAYFYKSPMLSADAALMQAEHYLLNLPEEGRKIVFNGLEEIPEENIRVHLSPKPGLWNELLNRMQWEVTVQSTEIHTTVIMDAHTGSYIGLVGAFS